MNNLLDFYFDNIKKEEYHYRFYELLKNLYIENMLSEEDNPARWKFDVYDPIEALSNIIDLCEPSFDEYTIVDNCLFYTSCYYIYKSGYRIKQFPDIVSRPYENLFKFTYDDIRNKLYSMGKKTSNGSVTWAERRAFVSDFELEKIPGRTFKNFTLDEKFREISNRSVLFSDMATDEKIAELNNMIEHLLKIDGKFIELDYSSISLSFIDEEAIKKYRKDTQCFRHKSEDAIEEKNKYTGLQKEFLIDYGILIVKTIHELVS